MAYRILLADDSITIQKVVELILSEEDVEIRSVNDGMEALESLNELKPDIVLADIEMPKVDGYELCEKIKNDPITASIPVILLAGAFEPFDEGRARDVGADDFLIKPFDSSDLLGKIEAIKPITQDEASTIEDSPAEEISSDISSKDEPLDAPLETEAISLEEESEKEPEKEPEEKLEEALEEEQEEVSLDVAWAVAEELTEEKEPATESENIEENIEENVKEIIEEIIEEPEPVELDTLDEDLAEDEKAWKTEELSASGFIRSEQAMAETEVILEAVEADPDMLVDAEAEVVILSEEFVSEPESMQMVEQVREAIPALSRDEVISLVRESVSSVLPDGAGIDEAVKAAISGAVPEKVAIDDYIRESVPVISREDVMSLVRESVSSMLPDGAGIDEAVKAAISGAVPEKVAIDDYIRESVPVISRDEVMSLVRESVSSMLPDGAGIDEAVKAAISGAISEKADINECLQKEISNCLPSKDDLQILIASSLDFEGIKAMIRDTVNEKTGNDLLPAFKSMIEDILLDLVPKTTEQVTREVLQETLPAGITKTIEKVSLESMPGLAENLIAKVIEKIRSGN